MKQDEAKLLLHGVKASSRDQLLVLLSVEPLGPRPVQEIRVLCKAVGLPKLARSNISDTLAKANGLAARTPTGWELQQAGIARVRELAKTGNLNLVVTATSHALRRHAEILTDPLTKSFVMEAITCFEAHQYRAAIVFAWAGAVAQLHKHVFGKKLAEFNAEATRRDAKWRSAKQQDDMGRMKEHDFLDVCEAIGVIGKNVKQVLQNECLLLRNSCGHPNSISIAEISVAAHIEKLIHNVFARFQAAAST